MYNAWSLRTVRDGEENYSLVSSHIMHGTLVRSDIIQILGAKRKFLYLGIINWFGME